MAGTWPARTWTFEELVGASLMNTHIRDNLEDLRLFEKTGVLYNENGITSTANIIMWRARLACKVKAVRGYRVGGTAASINARKNGSTTFLTGDLSVTTADTWMNGTLKSDASVNLAAGDKLEFMLTSVTGSPTQVGVQIEFELS